MEKNNSKIIDFIDTTQNESNAFVKFVENLPKCNDSYVHCFVEGIDDGCYYPCRIKKYLKKAIVQVYECGSKNEVVSIFNRLNSIYSKKCKMMFFVDRDYDLDDVPTKIYKTDKYSIENYYVSEAIFIKFIENKFLITPIDNNHKKSIDYFRKNYNNYSLYAIKINSFFYTIRSYEKNHKNGKVNFDNKVINQVFYCGRNLLTIDSPKISYYKLMKESKINYKIPLSDFMDNEKRFAHDNHFNFRGKQEIKFMIWIINQIKTSLEEGTNGFDRKKIHAFSLNANSLDYLSDFAETPNSLIEYIKSFQ